MQELDNISQNIDRSLKRRGFFGFIITVEAWFDQLDIPITEVIPCEIINIFCRIIETVFSKMAVDRVNGLLQLSQYHLSGVSRSSSSEEFTEFCIFVQIH